MNKKKIFKNIDSILQVTKETVNKSDNYYNYIINQNNSLYKKQLPLLMKNIRINALVLSKNKSDFKINNNHQNKEENKRDLSKTKKNKLFSPLSEIRNIQTRSKNLPPLCPLFNDKGELVPSIIKTSKIIFRKTMDFDDRNMNFHLGFNKMGSSQNIFKNKSKFKIKKLNYNKSDFDLKLDYDESENRQFNEPEYNNLKYDESKIFGHKKYYEQIIKKKIIEFQNTHNKNLTIQKEKIFKYGLEKIKMILTLDSLKIKINEIKDEKCHTIEKSEKPVFEYTLPLALLPLFYFKGVEQFLIILSKLISFNDFEETFEIAKNDDEIISNILKNCSDFNISDDNLNINNYNENGLNKTAKIQIDVNKKLLGKINANNNINDNKNIYLKNNFINNQTNSLYNQKNQKSIENNYNLINDNNNNINPNTRVGLRESFFNVKKKTKYKTYDVYPNKMTNEGKSISLYEFFWITNKKSYILTIETPLITVYIPSHKSEVKKYINYELLFYLYSTQFVMWDFYVIKHLSTYKNFRNFLEQIYSLPEKRHITFFIKSPKIKKNLFTFYELTSILTRQTINKNYQRESSSFDIKNNNNSNSNTPFKIKQENSKSQKECKKK